MSLTPPIDSPPLALEPRVLPEVHRYSDFTEPVVRARLRSGEWVRIARGAYLSRKGGESEFEFRDRLVLARIVVAAGSATPRWISHHSAAFLWGLPLLRVPQMTHVTQPLRTSPGKMARAGLICRTSSLPSAHCTVLRGIAVTTPERTVVDCLRFRPVREALVIADAALNKGVGQTAIVRVLGSIGPLRGTARARDLLALADGGADSPGETLTRLTVVSAGFPPPETQVEVLTRLGTFRADVGWREWRLLLEYDGRSKYEDGGSDAFMREKRRHDALVEAGFTVLRITKEDLRRPAELRARILDHLPPSAQRLGRVPRILRNN